MTVDDRIHPALAAQAASVTGNAIACAAAVCNVRSTVEEIGSVGKAMIHDVHRRMLATGRSTHMDKMTHRDLRAYVYLNLLVALEYMDAQGGADFK